MERELPIPLRGLRIGVVAVDAGLAGHLVGNGDTHHGLAARRLGARIDRVGVDVQVVPGAALELVELAIAPVGKRIRAEQGDRGVAVAQRRTQVVNECCRHRNEHGETGNGLRRCRTHPAFETRGRRSRAIPTLAAALA